VSCGADFTSIIGVTPQIALEFPMSESTRPQAVPTVHIENEWTRVTEWRFAPGAETGWHRHEMDYVVVPIVTGKLKIDMGGGEEVLADLQLGVPYARNVGVEHNVINANDFEFAFIELESKRIDPKP
jgi:quercetin dioxygenase-like cupin family protein